MTVGVLLAMGEVGIMRGCPMAVPVRIAATARKVRFFNIVIDGLEKDLSSSYEVASPLSKSLYAL